MLPMDLAWLLPYTSSLFFCLLIFFLVWTGVAPENALIKKKIKFSSYIRKLRWDWFQSHIWLTAFILNICAFPHILGSLSLYMTLQPIPSEFPYIWGKSPFSFLSVWRLVVSNSGRAGDGYLWAIGVTFLGWRHCCTGVWGHLNFTHDSFCSKSTRF